MSNLEMKTKRRVLVILGFTLPFWMLVACICAVPVQAQETSEPELKVEPVTQANYPNVLIDVSSRFVSAGISVPLNSCDPITDCIVGASISGQGQTIGNMTASLAHHPNHAAIQLNVKGNTFTSTVGTKDRVKFRSKGVIPFAAQRTLMFDKYGFTASITSGCASSDNRPQCVTAPRSKLVRRIAWRQLQNSKNQADQEIAQHTGPQVRKQLQDDSQKVIDEANAAYYTHFRQPLEEIGRFPQHLNFATANNKLKIILLKAAEGQVGADVPAPAFDLQHDIGLRIHESAFNNFAESLLGGHTLTDEELRTDVAKFLTLIKHKEYEPVEESDDWSVTFPDQKPITAEFRDGHYQLVISGEKWTSGGWEVDALDVTVTYKIQQTDAGVKLVRDGDIKIEPPQPLPLAQRAKMAIAKRVMARKFNHLFPEEIEAKGLVVPGPWAKVGAMHVAKIVATEGWMEVSWLMPQQSTGVMSVTGSTPTPLGASVMTTN
jgi:hypothetical protein